MANCAAVGTLAQHDPEPKKKSFVDSMMRGFVGKLVKMVNNKMGKMAALYQDSIEKYDI